MDEPDAWQVLIVDDDVVDRKDVRRAVRNTATPIHLYEAETVLEAREVLKTAAPDCVLVDMELPDGVGLELLADHPDVPFIVLTGHDDAETAGRALKSGAQDYLVKGSLSPGAIERSIRYAMERKAHEGTRQSLAHQDRLASLGRLAASVAHEVNNPAAFIAANLQVLGDQVRAWQALHDDLQLLRRERPELDQLLARHDSSMDLPEVAGIIRESSLGIDRIVGIVRQLGSFARRPDQDEPLQEVSLTEVASWACLLTQNRLQARATLIKELDKKLPMVVGRPGRLAQVATNLLVNATQALPDGKPQDHNIWVRTEQDEDNVYLIVEDTGPGFPEKVRQRAFDPFFTTKAQGEGTGLGLAIASDIVRAHAGEIAIEERLGGGARIVVRVPKDTGLQLPAVEKPESVTDAKPPILRILLVDDEAAIRRAYRRMLRPHDVIAEEASDALERLIEREDYAFDLILCDLMMPGIDGMNFYEHIADVRPALSRRIVFLTGGAFEERAQRFLEQVPNRVLSKPATKEDVLQAASTIIGGPTPPKGLPRSSMPPTGSG